MSDISERADRFVRSVFRTKTPKDQPEVESKKRSQRERLVEVSQRLKKNRKGY